MIVGEKRWRKTVIIYILITILAIFMFFPILNLTSISFRSVGELKRQDVLTLIPKKPSLGSFLYIIKETFFLRHFLNTLVVGAGTTILSLIIAIFASYSLSRFRFRGRLSISSGILTFQMFPGVLLLIPLFLIWARLRLLNTYFSLIMTYATFTLPFCVWMLKSYFDSVPRELDEAARLDGCSRMGTLFRVIIPLGIPGIMAVALFAFLVAYQEFMFASAIMTTNLSRTLPVSIVQLAGPSRTEWGPLAAQAVMSTYPLVIVFIFLQKYLVAGLTAGAVKG